MGNPFSGPLQAASQGLPSAPVVQPQNPMEQYIAMAMQMLQQTARRKLEQSQVAFSQVTPGTKYGDLTPDLQKSVRRATGRNYQPGDVVRPISSMDEFLTASLRDAGIAPDSALGQMLGTTAATRTATGMPTPLGGPDLRASEARANVAQAGTREVATATLASAERKAQSGETMTSGEAAAYQSAHGGVLPATAAAAQAEGTLRAASAGGAMGARTAIGAGQAPTEQQTLDYRAIYNFVPSVARTETLAENVRSGVLQQGARILANPESASFAPLLRPYGVNVGDMIGAVALGIGQQLDTSMQGRNIALHSSAEANNEALRQGLEMARTIGVEMHGAGGSPEFILRVMQGDQQALGTDRGRMIASFMNAGMNAQMGDLAMKGDPAAIAFGRLMEVLRNPTIAGNERQVTALAGTIPGIVATSLTRQALGFDRPTQAGREQQSWDAYYQSQLRQAQIYGPVGHDAHLFNPMTWLAPSYTGFQRAPGTAPDAPAPGQNPASDMQTQLQQFMEMIRQVQQGGGVVPGAGASPFSAGARPGGAPTPAAPGPRIGAQP